MYEGKYYKNGEERSKDNVSRTAGLAIITIHRPQLRNALTANMWNQLSEIGKEVLNNPKNKVVLLRGSGDQFTAGSDIKEFHQMTLEEAEHAFVLMEKTISTFEQLPIPTIGVINGQRWELVWSLHLHVIFGFGSEKARLGIPVGKLGITINNQFAQRLVSLINEFNGRSRLYWTYIEGRRSPSTRIIKLFSGRRKLDRYAIRMGKLLASQSPASLLAVKKAVSECVNSAPILWKGSTPFVDKHDFPEGVKAFVEKRVPNFQRRLNNH